MIVLAGGVLAMSLAVEAQPARSSRRVGILLTGSPAGDAQSTGLSAFTKALRDLGWAEGQDYKLEVRWAESPDQLSHLAVDLVNLGINVILTPGPQATLAARAATSTTPIVAIAGTGPQQVGAASLANPGGNVTGLIIGETDALMAKRFQLITEAIPGIARIAVVWDVKRGAAAADAVRSIDTAARSLKVQVQHLDISSVEDFESAFSSARRGSAGAVLLVESPRAVVNRALIARLALRERLPVMGQFSRLVEAGGWMSYGPDLNDLFARAASYVDKILKGSKPADLPVEQPDKFQLAINLKTAKALGLTIPPSLLLRADEVVR